mgnify:CR=1 FL=1
MKTNNKGITLIALVITIIILLILAAVAIQLALGDNGLIKKAQSGQEAQSIAEVKEKFKTLELAAWSDYTVSNKSSEDNQKYVQALNTALNEIRTPVIKDVTVSGTFQLSGSSGNYTLASSNVLILFKNQPKIRISMDTNGKTTMQDVE